MQVTKLEVHPSYRVWTLSRPSTSIPFVVYEDLVSGKAKNTYRIPFLQGKMTRGGTVKFPSDFKGPYYVPLASVMFSAINVIIDYQDIHGNLLPDVAGKFPITAKGITWTL